MFLLRLCFCFFFYFASAENVLVFLVEAPHLDYSSPKKLLKTMAKHPSNWSKNGDVGHAWLYLEGEIDGQKIVCEGGHSGELGFYQPTYLQGLLENISLGAADPIRYLFCTQEDGFFQKGSGGHRPTFAAKTSLTDEEFYKILQYLKNYPYAKYSLTGKQCCTLLNEIATLLGLSFHISRTIAIPSKIKAGNNWISLWNREEYSTLTFACPDLLEQELKAAVANKKLEQALTWYKKRALSSKVK